MNNLKTSGVFVLFLSIVLLTIGCNQSTDDDVDTESQTSATLNLRIRAANSNTSSSNANLLNQFDLKPLSSEASSDNDEFRPDYIASGPPEGFQLTIHKIALENENSSYTAFESDTGATISITNSLVDLSDLLQNLEITSDISGDESSDEAVFSIPAGTYSQLSITYKKAALIKGCVSANFRDESLYPGIHTYCTQADHSPFEGNTADNDDFEDKEPEWMQFDIHMQYDGGIPALGGNPEDQFEIKYSIPSALNLSEGDSTTITMVLDINRLLRYNNDGRSDQIRGYTFFFDSTFSNSVYVFLGSPGGIYGYYFVTGACVNASTIPSNHECTDNPFTVALWNTIIVDSSGDVLLSSYMPDDDDTLTVVKGSTNNVTGDFITQNEDGTINIKFVGNAAGVDQEGTIFNFPSDFSQTQVGGEIEGVYFEGLQDSYGLINVERKL